MTNNTNINIQYRQSRIDDARAIADMHVRSWLAAYSDIVPAEVLEAQSVDKEEIFWTEALKRNGEGVIVAVNEDDRVVGFVGTGHNRDDVSLGEIHAIYIDPDYYRQGHRASVVGTCT